jgi:zinc transport system permease protein
VLDDFLVRATLAGLGTALAAAPLGCFVVWRRMAFFGDATAHATLLGVALALALDISIFVGAAALALVVGLTVDRIAGPRLSGDTALGVLSHASLAAGLVAVSFISGVPVDLSGYLFGDILAVSRADLAVIWGGAAAVLAVVALRWSALLTATVAEDLAIASGLSPGRDRTILTVTLAVAIAVAIKAVGVLLIAALLVIPAAAARGLARTPEAMAALAVVIGCAAALAGLQASLAFDTPAGPSIVCAAAAAFALVRGAGALRHGRG